MSVLLITVIAGIAALLLFVALPIVYVKNYIKVPPNEVAVFTGRGQPKVVRGGARFRVPGIERVDIMSLEPFNVSINLQNALDADQRYRVFARTHLAAGPAVQPPKVEMSRK